ncbi:unnamed protein product, partial [Mesorhabditis belari]|uniref:Uncharacterized protein n=1 Tax=Mesorhabditis belari TaxID=2138241 RepID=A0AAF3ER81_9BILA
MGWYGPKFNLLTLLRFFIIVVSGIGAASIFAAVFVLVTTSPTLRAFIILVGSVLLLVSGVAWKMTSMDVVVGRNPVNSVFLRAYRAEYFDETLPQCVQRHPALLPFHCPTAPMSIPRPLIMPTDPPPSILAPPPPPTYNLSQRLQQNASQTALWATMEPNNTYLSRAPPVYSVCGALQRVCTSSPPPRYRSIIAAIPQSLPRTTPERRSSTIEIDAEANSDQLSVIDCSKPTPTTFHFPQNECSSI